MHRLPLSRLIVRAPFLYRSGSRYGHKAETDSALVDALGAAALFLLLFAALYLPFFV